MERIISEPMTIEKFIKTAEANQEKFNELQDKIHRVKTWMANDIQTHCSNLQPVFEFLLGKFFFRDPITNKGYKLGPVVNYTSDEDEIYYYDVLQREFYFKKLWDDEHKPEYVNEYDLLSKVKYEDIMKSLSSHLLHYEKLLERMESQLQKMYDLRETYSPDQ